jgi:hypothetical protein
LSARKIGGESESEGERHHAKSEKTVQIKTSKIAFKEGSMTVSVEAKRAIEAHI